MEKVARHYDWLSLLYDILDWPFEQFRYPRIRRYLCADLVGRVLDAGCGTGKNFPYYTREATVTAIDISEGMLARAEHRALKARASIEVMNMDATKLRFPDGHFDAVVSTYMFCVLPDKVQRPALMELLRVTKQGGQVRILEHRYSQRPWRRLLMKIYTPYVNIFFHSRYDHPIGDVVRSSGARIIEEKYVTSDIEKLYILSPGEEKKDG
jgi:ubiquinone/menaquinone biosynthesis C-methylase UbiE